jgi:hypothetical protein
VRLQPVFKTMVTVSGSAEILELTMMLEAGEIARFAKAGNYPGSGKAGRARSG